MTIPTAGNITTAQLRQLRDRLSEAGKRTLHILDGGISASARLPYNKAGGCDIAAVLAGLNREEL